jgi:transposase-like protein
MYKIQFRLTKLVLLAEGSIIGVDYSTRSRNTSTNIIECKCEAGSEIHSDEWAAYKCLTSRGFVHMTVNHQISYVDANTGAHTQNIERSWLDAKIKLLKKMKGVPLNHLQSHLNHYCWRLYRQDSPETS